ncbi:MAG: TadE family protein [Pseudomonadota bacterium]
MKPEIKHSSPFQRGATTVEMALVLTVFIILLFAALELGRAMYLWNTLQQVTRQAARDAIVTDFTDANAMAKIRQNAVFRGTTGTNPGALVAAQEITDAAVRITYHSIDAGGNLQDVNFTITPTCPPKVITDCLAAPNGATCIRFVQARICDPANAAGCDPIKYQAMVLPAFISGFANLHLPVASSIMPAESLGFRPSMPGC